MNPQPQRRPRDQRGLQRMQARDAGVDAEVQAFALVERGQRPLGLGPANRRHARCASFHRSMPVRLITGVIVRSSCCMKRARSCGEPPIGSMYCECIFSLVSGIASTALISRFMRCTISSGVAAGAMIAIQARFSISGRPASFMVGMSGVSALRLAVDTASVRSLPALTCGSTATAGTQANCTSPCRMARIASGDDA